MMIRRFLRFSCTGLLLLAAAGCEDSTEPGTPVPFTRVEQVLSLGPTQFGSMRLVLTTPSGWQDFWSVYTRTFATPPALPPVDFLEDAVLVVSSGERPGTGHSIRITGIEELTGAILVHVRTESPQQGSSCLLASVVTTPFDAVRLPQTSKLVMFSETHRITPCPADGS